MLFEKDDSKTEKGQAPIEFYHVIEASHGTE